MESTSHDDENGETEPVTPVKALTNKRLAVASPFSSASPQHRRPLKARNSSNEGDGNLEATMNESTFLDMSKVGNDQSMVKQDVSLLDEINEEELDVTLSEEIEHETEPAKENATSPNAPRGMCLADELGGLQDSSFAQTVETVNTGYALEGDSNLEATMMNLTVAAAGQSLVDELGALCDSSFEQVSNTPTPTPHVIEEAANLEASMNAGRSLADELGVLCDNSFEKEGSTPAEGENKLDSSTNAGQSLADELGGICDNSFGNEGSSIPTPTEEENKLDTSMHAGQSLADELGALCDASFEQVSNTPTPHVIEEAANLETSMTAGRSLADELGGTCDNSFGNEGSSIPTPTEEENKLDTSTNAGQSLADELGGLCDTSFGQEGHNIPTPAEDEPKLEDMMNTGPSLSDELAGLDTSVVSSAEKVVHSNETVSDSCGPPSDTLNFSDIIGTVSYSVNTSATSANGLSSLASELAGIVSDESSERPLDLSNTALTEEANVEAVSLTEEHNATISPPEQSFTDYLTAPSDVNTADVSMAEISTEEVASNKSSFTPNDDSDRTPTRERSLSGPGRLSPTQSDEDVAKPLPSFHNNSMAFSPSFNARSSKFSDSMVEFIMYENDIAREDDNSRVAEFKALQEESVCLKETIASLEDKLAKEAKTRDLAEKEREDFKFMFEDGTARAKKKETDYRKQIMALEDRLRETEENSEGLKALQEKAELLRSSEENQQRLAEDLEKLQAAADILSQQKTQCEAELALLKETNDLSATELNIAKNSLGEMEQRLNEQTSRVAELETSITDGTMERDLIVKEASILRQKLDEMSSQELASQDRIRVAEEQADKLTTQVKELKASLESRCKDEEVMAQELTALRQKLDASTSQEDLEIMKERALAAERSVEDTSDKLQAALKEIEKVRNAAAEETAVLRQKLEGSTKQEELESMKEEAEIAAKEKEELANTISQLEKTVQNLQFEKGDIEKNATILQEKFDHAIREAESLSAQHEELRLRQEAADEMLLEEKAVGEELRSQLKMASDERSAFEGKLSQSEQAASLHKKAAEDLREQLRVLTSDSEASQDAVRLKCAELEMKLEMAESQLGTLASLREQLKTSKVSNAELEMKIKVCRKRLDELDDTKNRLAETQERVEELEVKLKVLDSEGGAQEEKQKELSVRIAAQTEAIARLEMEKAEINEQLLHKSTEIKEMAAKTEEALVRAAEQEEIISTKTAEVETLRRQLDTVATQAAESAEVVAKLTSTNKDLEKSLEERRRSAINVLPVPASKSADEEKLKNKIEELEQALAKEKDETEKAWQMCDEADEKEAEFQRRISALIDENNTLKTRLGENSTGGLLDALRPSGMQELPSGSPVADRTGSSLNASTSFSLARSSPAPNQTLATDYAMPTAGSPLKKTDLRQDKTCKQQ